MTPNYADAAANERTYLAWVRTGIAVVALGFVIERFNLFLLALAAESGTGTGLPQLRRLASPAGRYGGAALVCAGVLIIILATIRFRQKSLLLAGGTGRFARMAAGTLAALTVLILAVAAFSAYLAIS